jgi:hypothetical protein
MMKRIAEVTLREESIHRMACGNTVTIKLEDIELQLRFDPLARLGSSSTLEDVVRAAMHRPSLSSRNRQG